MGKTVAAFIVAALAAGGAAADPTDPAAAVKAAGYHSVHVVARRALVLVEAVKQGHDRLLAVRGDEVLELDPDLDRHRATETSGTVRPFFGNHELLDVAVTLGWSNGMGSSQHEIHYLVRTAGALDLACRFDGASSSGMEDRNRSTSVDVHKIKSAPLIFEVESRTSGGRNEIDQGNGNPNHREPNLVRYVVPATGRCEKKSGYGIPAR